MSLLSAQHVSLRRGQRQILDDVSLELRPGELLGLVGPNGAGKSTLLQIMAGLIKPDHGSIKLHKYPLHKLKPQQRSRKLAWLEQNGQINWPLSVERLVALGRLPHLAGWQQPGKQDMVAIEQAMQASNILHLRERDTMTLSGGERSRVLMARALAAQPEILLADEPIAALDLGHQLQTMELLKRFVSEQRGCAVVLHDLSLAARYCDRLYLLHEGSIITSGNSTEVLSANYLKQVYGVECLIGNDGVPFILPLHAT